MLQPTIILLILKHTLLSLASLQYSFNAKYIAKDSKRLISCFDS